MVRSPCCDQKEHVRKGAWTKQEDERLINYIKRHGEGSWKSLPKAAGLLRCGKSCRLRWINYLRPDLKRGSFTREEEELIIHLQKLIGNKWSIIASRLPGRTDNEIKNYWNTHIKRRLLDRGIHLQPQPKNNINTTIPSFQQAQYFTMQSGDNINPMVHNILNVTKTDSAISSDYSGSSSSTILFSDHEIKPEINLELSMSLPQSHDVMKINDKFKMEKKWEFHYPQLFGKSSSTSSSIRPIAKESVCLCYNLGGYHNGNSSDGSCNKCVCLNVVDGANRLYRPLRL